MKFKNDLYNSLINSGYIKIETFKLNIYSGDAYCIEIFFNEKNNIIKYIYKIENCNHSQIIHFKEVNKEFVISISGSYGFQEEKGFSQFLQRVKLLEERRFLCDMIKLSDVDSKLVI